MAGTFSNRKKLILLANAIEQNLDYIKQSDSLFKENEIRGRKYGMAVHGYLPDAGSTNRGLVAVPDKAHQVEVTAWMDNYNTAAEVDMWDRLVNIEDFNKEMVEKRAKKLGFPSSCSAQPVKPAVAKLPSTIVVMYFAFISE
mgnify:CR=1 FL=1